MAQTVVLCSSCSTVIAQPTGGRARITPGCRLRSKGEEKRNDTLFDNRAVV
ncbi:40S ribosomal protein S27 [Cavenderia fasciculata]|uniref:40S ribosomal protein S27 n=1 Tax=Cavenderia fasciculata TaxID=261658 RepID=F4QCR0_CACFS|nr:40S ribosomal protein S27 [Cavenderia fasciculata]EGG13642.1 40S ribosomal protein S27 [Cavenderia fasciculata]|eukprot:XP_004350346.1 40S ribosomal protein S27 [Cavenderia fasciculata]